MPEYSRSADSSTNYTQAGNLFRLMKPDTQKRLIANIVGSMKTVPKAIQERQIAHFLKADLAYGRGVAEGLGLNVEHLLPQEPAPYDLRAVEIGSD